MRRLRGFGAFTVVWLGQFASLVGSSLTSFALGVWAYQVLGSATAYSLVVLATMAPNALLSLFVGPIVDRWDRRWVMALSDIGAGLCTLAVLFLLGWGRLAFWPILLATALNSAFSAFQWPAYAASITMMLPKEQYGRANGMVQLARAASLIISPAAAGFLMKAAGIQLVILIDFITLAFALLTLLFVYIPRPAPSVEATHSFWQDFLYGLRYLAERPGLMGLLVLFALLNFLLGFVLALFGPMVLAFSDEQVLGTLTSIGAFGMLVGGGLMGVWGGPRRRIHGVLGPLLLAGLAIGAAGARPSAPLITVAAFGFFFSFAVVSASSDSIWQSKVAPDVQGRVFGARSTIATIGMAPAYLLAGPLADHVFEPLLKVGGPLAGSVGRVIGVGPGRGIGFMFLLSGVIAILATVASYGYPRIRLIEDELPDVTKEEADRGLLEYPVL